MPVGLYVFSRTTLSLDCAFGNALVQPLIHQNQTPSILTQVELEDANQILCLRRAVVHFESKVHSVPLKWCLAAQIY